MSIVKLREEQARSVNDLMFMYTAMVMMENIEEEIASHLDEEDFKGFRTKLSEAIETLSEEVEAIKSKYVEEPNGSED